MAIILDLGKLRVKEILTEAYLFAKEQTELQRFYSDDQDAYPRGIKVNFITKKDKLDWMILEELANEISWFFAERKTMRFAFKLPDYGGRHDKEIYFQNRIEMKLNELGLKCSSDVYYRG